jgi:hypothetical protein
LDYSVKLKGKGRMDDKAILTVKLNSTPEDCQFLYQCVTFALGNPGKVEALMLAESSEEDGESNPIGFVQ